MDKEERLKRHVFAYHDGTRDVYGDPKVLLRRITQASMGQMDAIMDASYGLRPPPSRSEEGGGEGQQQPPPPAEPTPEEMQRQSHAQEQRARVIYEAFRLKPLDPETGEGLPEEEALAVLVRFYGWLWAREDAKQQEGKQQPQQPESQPSAGSLQAATTTQSSQAAQAPPAAAASTAPSGGSGGGVRLPQKA
jgi:hypothetical protein